MWMIIVFGIANVILSAVGTYAFGLPGLDLTLIGVIILGLSGENVLIGSIVLTIAYMLPKPDRFAWFPLQMPSAWLVGWLAGTYDMIYLPIIIFHVLATGWSVVFGSFGGRFLLHTGINIGLSLVVVHFYVLIT